MRQVASRTAGRKPRMKPKLLKSTSIGLRTNGEIRHFDTMEKAEPVANLPVDLVRKTAERAPIARCGPAGRQPRSSASLARRRNRLSTASRRAADARSGHGSDHTRRTGRRARVYFDADPSLWRRI